MRDREAWLRPWEAQLREAPPHLPLESGHGAERSLRVLKVQRPKVESLKLKLLGCLVKAHARSFPLNVPWGGERMRLLHREVCQWHEVQKRPLNEWPVVLWQDGDFEARLGLVSLGGE